MTVSNPNTAYSYRPPGQVIREGYDAVAKFYDDAYKSVVDQAHDAFLLELMRSAGLRQLPKNSGSVLGPNVIDLGCGTGWFLDEAVANWWPRQYLGFDFSHGMLNQARSKYPVALLASGQLHWALCDLNDVEQRAQAITAVRTLPLNASGEWIVSLFESPNYIRDLRELVGEMSIRFLEDGARLSFPRRAILQYSTASRAKAGSLTRNMGLAPFPVTYDELRRLWPSAQIVSFGSLWADHQIEAGYGSGCMKLESWLLRWMPGSVRDRAYWHVVIL